MKAIPFLLLLLVSPLKLAAQNTFTIDRHTIAGGGGTSVGGVFALSGTAGQPDASAQALSGGIFALSGGYWPLSSAPPPDAGDVIFDNSEGSANGGSAVTSTTWLAGRFAPLTQAYRLDSVSVLLNNQDFSGAAGPPCIVQLQIYDSDPASGKPSAATGVVMNLSGRTNPITLSRGQELVKWTPSTLFTLLPNASYFAVLSAEDGKRMGQIASFTRPTGDAGAFGASVTTNSGATWSSPAAAGDSNLKMLIRATPVPPPVAAITIFDNTAGSENGAAGATATTWLAGKFCPGAQGYQLDSLSLVLTNGGGQSTGSSMVRLRIFDHDPVTGNPSTDTGVIMDLQDQINPFPVSSHKLYRWASATPLTLSANTCYWAVFSIESGVTAGPFASFTKPTGDAGVFGYTRTENAGATWGTPYTSFNFKMLIKGIPLSAPPPVAEMGAGMQTAIPGGTGNFTGFLNGPGLSGNNLVFYGSGSGGQLGLYLTNPGLLQVPSLIANRNTPIPGGTGNFLSFGSEAGIIIVSGSNAVFAGGGSGGQQGVYAAVMTPPFAGTPLRIADLATPIPNGSGSFTDFPSAPGISGDTVVFSARGDGAQEGIYAAVLSPPEVGAPLRIADIATAIPGGSGSFTSFPGGPAVSGSNAVFAGSGADGQRGVYGANLTPTQAGEPFRIADTNTAIPGGTGNFVDFGTEAGIIIVSGSSAIFGGTGAGGQSGLYGAALAPPLVGPPFRIADTTTAIPGGTGNFTGFGATSVSETDVAFLGMGSGGQAGIYDLTRGQLLKVIAVGEKINGKRITGLNFSRGGLFEDPIAFQATFEDGSQGVYRIPVIAPEFDFRITAVEQEGNDLLISFNSLAGRNYTVQGSADLTFGTWTVLPGPAASGTGGIIQTTILNGLNPPWQFYRVLQLP